MSKNKKNNPAEVKNTSTTASTSGSKTASSTPKSVFVTQKIYTKDIAVQLPTSPEIFKQKVMPQVDFKIKLGNKKLVEGNVYEVTAAATVNLRINDQIAAIIKAAQAGIFTIDMPSKEQTDYLLGIICPNLIYPHLREIVCELSTRAGFPPVHMAHMDFATIATQTATQQKNAQPKQ